MGTDRDSKSKIDNLNTKFDAIIKTAKGFVDNPSTYIISAYTSFMTEYTKIIEAYTEVGEATDNASDFSNTDTLDLYSSIIAKNTELLTLISKFPSKYA